jgi:hypothetical protein
MVKEQEIEAKLREDARAVEQSFRVLEDEHGKYVKAAPNSSPADPSIQEKSPYTSQTAAAKGALKAVTDYISFDAAKANAADDTIVDVKVRNPFHRIMKLLQDIKSKQSTTVSMRFTIPLIALPIVLLAAFQLGRAQTVCASRFTSQVGVLRSINIMAPPATKDVYSNLLSFFPDIPKLQKTEELTATKSTILVNMQGEVLNVFHTAKLEISSFANEGVIISGMLSPCAGTITLDDPQNITRAY